MDLSHLDADSPVLWMRLDPQMSLMRSVLVEQPDNQWQYQLRHERDVTAQTDAINALEAMAKIGGLVYHNVRWGVGLKEFDSLIRF